MSQKSQDDKQKPGYPFTARQARQKLGGRRARKAAKGKAAYRRGTQPVKTGQRRK